VKVTEDEVQLIEQFILTGSVLCDTSEEEQVANPEQGIGDLARVMQRSVVEHQAKSHRSGSVCCVIEKSVVKTGLNCSL